MSSYLDKIIGGNTITDRLLGKCSEDFVYILNLVKSIFPRLKETRFKNSADFYSLFMFLWQKNREGMILKDRIRNQQAEKLLIELSKGVDDVKQQLRRAEGATKDQGLFAEYLLTVQGDSDSSATRERRLEILKKVLGNVFDKKDKNRSFTIEQRRLIWHSDEKKVCSKCNSTLSWENFTIDHIKPHAIGGKTSLSNAQLMCRNCNSKKGAR